MAKLRVHSGAIQSCITKVLVPVVADIRAAENTQHRAVETVVQRILRPTEFLHSYAV